MVGEVVGGVRLWIIRGPGLAARASPGRAEWAISITTFKGQIRGVYITKTNLVKQVVDHMFFVFGKTRTVERLSCQQQRELQ